MDNCQSYGQYSVVKVSYLWKLCKFSGVSMVGGMPAAAAAANPGCMPGNPDMPGGVGPGLDAPPDPDNAASPGKKGP